MLEGNEMKDKIAQLRKVVDSITDDTVKKEYADTLSSVEQFVKTAEDNQSKTEGLQEKLDTVQGERDSFERDMMKEKALRKKAESHINERDDQIEEVNKKMTEFDKIKLENENLQSLKVERDAKIRTDYEVQITALKERPNFDNFKDDLVFPTDETPLDKIPMEEIVNSKAKIDDWTKRGFLNIEGGEQTKPTGGSADKETRLNRVNKMRVAAGLPIKKE